MDRHLAPALLAVLALALAGHAAPPEAGRKAEPAPAQGAPDPRPVRFAVIGDYGVGDANEAAVAALVAGWAPDFVITTGDNNYPDGEAATLDANVGKHWSAFIGGYRGAYGKGSPENRFWPTPGNHDWRGREALRPYLDYFHPPGNGRYYDVALAGGRVHLFALDSDTREPDGVAPGSAQGRWAQARLAASTACVKLVAFHHAAWSSSSTHGSVERMRWPFKAWGADLVVAGHDHVYERLEAQGITWVTSGNGGADLYGFEPARLPESKVRYSARHGATLLTLAPGALVVEHWSVAGERVDRFELKKECL